MRYLLMIGFIFIFAGCVSVEKGDYVTYKYDNYLFLEDSFLDKSIDCVELGKMKNENLNVKYCVGKNYASHSVQGFIFEHKYKNLDERFIGATLSFKKGIVINIPCSSETIEGQSSGKEYINCMTVKNNFDIYRFLVNSKKDVLGQLRAAVGVTHIYNGVVDTHGKKIIKDFQSSLKKKEKGKWKDVWL